MELSVRGIDEGTAFAVCCDGTPILDSQNEPAYLFPHDGSRAGRKTAYAAAKQVVDKLSKSAPIAARVVNTTHSN